MLKADVDFAEVLPIFYEAIKGLKVEYQSKEHSICVTLGDTAYPSTRYLLARPISTEFCCALYDLLEALKTEHPWLKKCEVEMYRRAAKHLNEICDLAEEYAKKSAEGIGVSK